MIGKTLGHYKVLEKLGGGGMGEVWTAQDTKLSRRVALKTLPPEIATAERLMRFEREARAVAALDHPNIVTLYSVEEADGTHFITMELVRGKALTKLIPEKGLPLDRFLDIAIPLADAVSAAHDMGITHRDLKPDNLMVSDAGRLKILDFGLAKLRQESAHAGISELPTESRTQEGRILGTATYMSPEQAEGKTVDHRSDVFSMGIILYEMATGERPFKGDSTASITSSILKDTPRSATEVNPGLPRDLGKIISRCLVKDADHRYQTAKDLRNELEELRQDVESGAVREGVALASAIGLPRKTLRWAIAAGIAVAAVMVGGLAGWLRLRTGPSAPPTTKTFAITLPGLATGASDALLALSRDGRTLVYRGTSEGTDQLYRRPMGQLGASRIRGTDGASNPFLSPDGRWVGFFRQGELRKVSLAGGPSFTICDAPMWSTASWGPDDTIVFRNQNSGLSLVSADGGVPEELTTREFEGEVHWSPHFLSDGRAVLFTVYVGMKTRRIMVYSFDTKEQRLLVDGAGPRFSSGHIVFWQADSLWAVPFDVNRLETVGDPLLVREHVQSVAYATPQFDVADDGSLVYVTHTEGVGRTLVWVDRQGREETTGLPPADYTSARVSPDGSRVVVGIRGDVWIAELARGTLTMVTGDPWMDFMPIWTSDGHRVVFDSHRDEPVFGLFSKAADGTGSVERLMSIEHDLGPSGRSPDGTKVLFEYWYEAQHIDIGVLSMEGERAWEPLLQTESNETAPAVSPDGRWIAYASDETGRYEVYVQRFPDLGERRQISAGGGIQPLWSPDGRQLFYRRWDDDAMMVISVDTAPSLIVGNPEVMFNGPYYRLSPFPFFRVYDVAPDGRLLMIREGEGPSTQVIVVLNLFENLERAVPTS